MDAHVFRLISEELVDFLQGARLEKIHSPARDLTVFSVFRGVKRKLVLGHSQQRPFLFLTPNALANPATPPAWVMRLRKYAGGRFLGKGIADFSQRALALPVMEGGLLARYLILDLRNGPSIAQSLPEGFGREPAWPDDLTLETCCSVLRTGKEASEAWRMYPVLTPLLRETLSVLDPLEGKALVRDLQTGGGGLFLYADKKGSDYAGHPSVEPVFYAAWPLPEKIMAARGLSFMKEVYPAEVPVEPGKARESEMLATVSRVDEAALSRKIAETISRPGKKEATRENKKIRRLLAKLDQEEKRLQGMLEMRKDALLLQRNIWRFAKDEKLAEICLPINGITEEDEVQPAWGGEAQDGAVPFGPAEAAGCSDGRRIRLNPLLTVKENMAAMFHQSARGRRGLAMLEKRRETLGKETGDESEILSGSVADAPTGKRKTGPEKKGAEGKTLGRYGRDIALFTSSDGFTILRGKNAKGNHALLKVCQPFDLWLHARGGPSAHVIIRKTHPGSEVPEKTLEEAARLVGEKSWQRNAGKADIMVALAKHVHPVKGAAEGTVRVDCELPGLVVDLGD